MSKPKMPQAEADRIARSLQRLEIALSGYCTIRRETLVAELREIIAEAEKLQPRAEADDVCE